MVQKRGKVKSHPAKFFLFISQPERMSGRWLYGAVHDRCSTGCSSSSHLSLPSSSLNSLFFPFFASFCMIFCNFTFSFCSDFLIGYLFSRITFFNWCCSIGWFWRQPYSASCPLKEGFGCWVRCGELMQLLVWDGRCKGDWRTEIWFSGDEDDSLCCLRNSIVGPM